MSKHKVMSRGKADRTDQRSSKQPSSGLLGSGLLTWDSLRWDSCGQGRYGVGAAAAAGGAVGVALFDKVWLCSTKWFSLGPSPDSAHWLTSCRVGSRRTGRQKPGEKPVTSKSLSPRKSLSPCGICYSRRTMCCSRQAASISTQVDLHSRGHLFCRSPDPQKTLT